MTRIVLVSCVKAKAPGPAPARELYVSPLFRGMRAYAEEHADAWFILSAQHGLVRPDQLIAPYERTLAAMAPRERVQWGAWVRHQLEEQVPLRADVTILAGLWYRRHIDTFLRRRGHVVRVPLMGLGIGRQLAYFAARSKVPALTTGDE